MSFRRQRSIIYGGRYRQVSLYVGHLHHDNDEKLWSQQPIGLSDNAGSFPGIYQEFIYLLIFSIHITRFVGGFTAVIFLTKNALLRWAPFLFKNILDICNDWGSYSLPVPNYHMLSVDATLTPLRNRL